MLSLAMFSLDDNIEFLWVCNLLYLYKPVSDFKPGIYAGMASC